MYTLSRPVQASGPTITVGFSRRDCQGYCQDWIFHHLRGLASGPFQVAVFVDFNCRLLPLLGYHG